MGDVGLKPQSVIAFLDSRDERLRKTAEWVLSRKTEWGEAVVQHFSDQLDRIAAMSAEQRATLAKQLARFSTSEPIQRLLVEMLLDRDSASRRDVALVAMNSAGLKETPDAWIDGLARMLARADSAELPRVIATVKALRILPNAGLAVQEALGRIGADAKRPMDLRIAALSASTASGLQIGDDMFGYLKSRLSADSSIDQRGVAVDVLARAKLSSERLLSLTENVTSAGPIEIERLVSAFGQSANNEVGQALLTALEKSPSFAAVRTEVLTSSLSRCTEDVRRQAEQLSKSRVQTTEEQTLQLNEYLATLPEGDIRRGQAVFNSTKAACTSCHAIGYLGGKLGPDLTKIGEVRTERDLLEAILFPSASFVRSYEPLAVLKTNGTIVSGLVRKDAPDEIVLATSATEEQRVPRSEIEDVRAGNTSIMPAGLDGQLTREQLADLVAFLKACR
jgi:putative heme-binding domain-containing protein